LDVLNPHQHPRHRPLILTSLFSKSGGKLELFQKDFRWRLLLDALYFWNSSAESGCVLMFPRPNRLVNSRHQFVSKIGGGKSRLLLPVLGEIEISDGDIQYKRKSSAGEMEKEESDNIQIPISFKVLSNLKQLFH
jgi:hypothetical protein